MQKNRQIDLDILLADVPPIRSIGNAPDEAQSIRLVSSDSREIPRYGVNALFVAITGAVFDGHAFVRAAYDAGCRVFALSHECALPSDALQLIYPDTRKALALLSASLYRHPSKKLMVIGITGTKGKTTTALLAKKILTDAGVPTGYVGTNGIHYKDVSYETPNTTPESTVLQRVLCEMAEAGIRVALIEVSSQALMQHRVYGIEFHATVFTNLSPDHIGGNEHPDFEHYKETKRLLFTRYPSKKVIINRDDPYATEFLPSDERAVKAFSSSPSAEKKRGLMPPCLFASEITPSAEENRVGVSFLIHGEEINQKALPAFLPLPGACNVQNALAALLIAKGVGVPIEKTVPLLREASIEGRCEAVSTENGARVLIDYAHNEASLREILTALRDYTDGRLIVLFGSVGGRTKERRAPMGAVASSLADFCILTSDNPDLEPPEDIISDIARGFVSDCPYVTIPDRAEAIRYGLSIMKKGDLLLLAGKGHEVYQLVNGEKRPFSEKEIVREWLSHVPHA